MRWNSRRAALTGLRPVVIFVGQALPQVRMIGKALYEKLQREGRRRVGGPAASSGPPTARPPTPSKTAPSREPTSSPAKRRPLRRRQAPGRGQRDDRPPGGQAVLQPLPVSRRRKEVHLSGLQQGLSYDLTSSKVMSYEPERSITGVRGRAYGDVLSPDLEYRTFTRNYNLYVKDMDGAETALTTDGSEDLRNRLPRLGLPRGARPVSGLLVVARFDEDRLHAVRREPGFQVPHRARRSRHAALRAPGIPGAGCEHPSSDCSSSRSPRRRSSGWIRATISTSTSIGDNGRTTAGNSPTIVSIGCRTRSSSSRPTRREEDRLFLTTPTPATSTSDDRPPVPEGQPAFPLDLGAERLARDLSLRPGDREAPQAADQRQASRPVDRGRRRDQRHSISRVRSERHRDPPLQSQARRHRFCPDDQGAGTHRTACRPRSGTRTSSGFAGPWSLTSADAKAGLVPPADELECLIIHQYFKDPAIRAFLEEMADQGAQGYLRPFTVDEEQSMGVTFPGQPAVRAIFCSYDRLPRRAVHRRRHPPPRPGRGREQDRLAQARRQLPHQREGRRGRQESTPRPRPPCSSTTRPTSPRPRRRITEWDSSCCLFGLRDGTSSRSRRATSSCPRSRSRAWWPS